MEPVMQMVMYTLTLGIYFIGANLINNSLMADKLTLFGDMVVFSTYAMQIIMSFIMLSMIFMMLPRANVSATRINEVLDEKLTVNEGLFNGDTKETGTVEFKNVSFKYPDADEYLLKNISFKAEKGQTIAFIGSTGSGKSTLINLVPRFYDASDGEVCYHETYLGSRIKRGLFKSSKGQYINADLNGALNILKKEVPNAFEEYGREVCSTPLVITIK
jgi:ATP-binding cassette subfamily B protein